MQFMPMFEPKVLRTERLLLRAAKMRDAQDMYEYAKDPQVAQYVLWDAHTSVRETKNVLRHMIRDYHYAPPFSYVIEHLEDGKVIGTIGLMTVSRLHRSTEVGYSLSRAYWNQGLMTEALIRLIQYCFEELHFNRVEAQHETENPASGAVMRKAGMKHEGTLQKRIYNKGQFRDVELYAIIKEDFHAHA